LLIAAAQSPRSTQVSEFSSALSVERGLFKVQDLAFFTVMLPFTVNKDVYI